jgi:hypothetical protein
LAQTRKERRTADDRHDQRARPKGTNPAVLQDGKHLVAIERPTERITGVGKSVLVERAGEKEGGGNGAERGRKFAEREEASVDTPEKRAEKGSHERKVGDGPPPLVAGVREPPDGNARQKHESRARTAQG